MIALSSEVLELQPLGLQFLVPLSSYPTVLQESTHTLFATIGQAQHQLPLSHLSPTLSRLLHFPLIPHNYCNVLCIFIFIFTGLFYKPHIIYNCDSTPYTLNLLSFAWMTVFPILSLSYLHIPKKTSRNGFLSCDAYSTITFSLVSYLRSVSVIIRVSGSVHHSIPLSVKLSHATQECKCFHVNQQVCLSVNLSACPTV
jgi:hypothetical protein